MELSGLIRHVPVLFSQFYPLLVFRSNRLARLRIQHTPGTRLKLASFGLLCVLDARRHVLRQHYAREIRESVSASLEEELERRRVEVWRVPELSETSASLCSALQLW